MSNPILIINNGLAGGGIERASVSLANHFIERGYAVTVLALYQSNHFFTLHPAIKIIEPDFSRKDLNQYSYVLKMIFFARKNIKAIKPRTILAFSEWTNPYVVLANIGLSYPLFLSDRMSPLAKLPFISEFLKRRLYPRVTGIIVQSNFSKSIMKKKTNAKNINVIYNPVNVVEKIACVPQKKIVSVGRLEPVKGHKFLIEAFAMIDSKEWELSIVGDGSLRSELEELCKTLQIADRVIFHGHLKDFRLQLSEAEIFVLPSLSEGFPNALIEAMSVPLACVATDTFYGHHEIVDSGVNGILVKPGDTKELASALKLLIRDANLRLTLKQNAFKVREDLAFNKISDTYLNVILS